MEYGHSFGLLLLLAYFCFFLKCPIPRTTMLLKSVFVGLVFASYFTCRRINEKELPGFSGGFYFSEENAQVKAIVQSWPESSRDYKSKATPYLVTGDARTGIPYLINPIPFDFSYVRVWVTSTTDPEEAIALDIAFPERHSTKLPIYFLLHGLNGGSDEGYIREFTKSRLEEGSTVVVLIARGLMDTPVNGWNVWHAARISDVHDTLNSLQNAVSSQILVGAGYSMGGIILGNYMARCEPYCLLDAAVSVSGGLNLREMLNHERSIRLWQPLLADEFRNKVLRKFCMKYRERLTSLEFLNFLHSSSISKIDEYAVANYNQYHNVTQYYDEVSAMGDYSSTNSGRISNVSRPFLVLHAMDDPLITWKATTKDPQKIVELGNGNIMLLLTETGGHVGWPTGLLPHINGWRWMNNIVRDFTHAVDSTKNLS